MYRLNKKCHNINDDISNVIHKICNTYRRYRVEPNRYGFLGDDDDTDMKISDTDILANIYLQKKCLNDS